ncbi:unnamed protein product [Nippostrongylus brasiliensis]|uniref:RRM domain-containing protein n=1 Tax=Nippostrongylus brasiliensis TaxID=27835 RepID=A0A0N4XCX0_NIPBR|nr:unnamed protein product [Nippostrongylus brasiliensis]
MSEADENNGEALVDSCQVEENGSSTEEIATNFSEKPSSSKLEELFDDRYTMANEEFVKICKGFDPVVCIPSFHSKQRRNFDNNGGNRRGGWGRGRGDWRGGRGDWRGGRGDHRNGRGHYQGGRGDGQWNNDRREQKRPWNDRRDDGPPDRRPRY